MAGRSGLDGQLGVATESEFGVYKAPTRFFEFLSESLALSLNYIESAGLRAGRMAQSNRLHRGTTKTVGGDFSLAFMDQGMGIFLDQLHGETITPTKLETGSKKLFEQVHKIGVSNPFAKSMTIQVGRPDVGGTVNPFSYLGCKITEYKLTIDQGGEAMLSITVDGVDEKTGESLGSATFDTDSLPFTFQQVAMKLGGSEKVNVQQVTLAVAVGYNTGRYTLGNKGLKRQQIPNALLSVTADATLEFESLADHTRYTAETEKSLEIIGTGAEPESGKGDNFKATFAMPAVKQVGSSPTIQGPDIVTQSVQFKALDDGTNAPLTATILSTDSTI